MIHKLSIRNFKSIRELDLDCRRVNVFIGEPNAGKTNVLEALGLWSVETQARFIEALRVTSLTQLHLNNDPSLEIEVTADSRLLRIVCSNDEWEVVEESDKKIWSVARLSNNRYGHRSDKWLGKEGWQDLTSFYFFQPGTDLGARGFQHLSSPFGQNLVTLLLTSQKARQSASSFFSGTGFRLKLDSATQSVSIVRELDDTLLSFPYSSASETLRRMIFFTLAIETNSNRVLVFDEPEAHSFPPYTKTLAERIALDDHGNQFFLTTHSPYMLDSLLSKTPASDLNVVLCRMENFETKAYPLNQEQIDQIKEWSMDAFFNFDRLLPEVK
jgi:AAA15 family ATPase/GTPase